MDKRRPNLHAWQWRTYSDNHQHPVNLVLHIIAVPIFIVAALSLVSGLFTFSFRPLVLGVIGILASLALQAHGHKLEAVQAEPFNGRRDAVGRLLMEQFVTFPRFILSGQWWRNWRRKK
ncbi:Mpo1-like protein [Pseudomonas sp. Q1-7]|uniref:Mpo1-like protein n=1 Tax=Pseudomonas sp. Q1-7 TaxID=3020843 RepID=UPI0023018C7A|nr:Mpo1-like protein [Pseudomonas sp. Q1-7]